MNLSDFIRQLVIAFFLSLWDFGYQVLYFCHFLKKKWIFFFYFANLFLNRNFFKIFGFIIFLLFLWFMPKVAVFFFSWVLILWFGIKPLFFSLSFFKPWRSKYQRQMKTWRSNFFDLKADINFFFDFQYEQKRNKFFYNFLLSILSFCLIFLFLYYYLPNNWLIIDLEKWIVGWAFEFFFIDLPDK